MTGDHAGDTIRTGHGEDPEALGRRMSDLAGRATAATQAYDRLAWLGYITIFVPIPFAVLVFRLHMEAWHYYVAGGLFVVVALVVYSLDSAAANRRDEPARAVERAQHTGEPVSPWFSSQALACLNC